MALKIPNKKKVVINGRVFRLDNNLTKEQISKLVENGGNTYGATNYSDRHIAITEHKNSDEQVITYVHEVVHVALIHSGLSQVITGDIQEVICESVANAVFDAFK